jgi:hypothetical protein
MEDNAGRRITVDDRHPQRVDDQVDTHVAGDGEPDHPPRVAVDHRGQVRPAGPGPDVRDVSDPGPVRAGWAEVTAQQVRQSWIEPIAPGRPLVRPRMHATQASGTHQPVHPLVRAEHTGAAQLVVDPAHPDPSAVSGVDLTDARGQGGVVELVLRGRPVTPLEETLPGHAHQPAHEHDRECLLRGLYAMNENLTGSGSRRRSPLFLRSPAPSSTAGSLVVTAYKIGNASNRPRKFWWDGNLCWARERM